MLYATAGAKLYIGGVLAMKSSDFIASDFDGQSWTEIKQLESLGSIGDTSEEIAQTIIGEARTKRLKGTRNAGTMEIVYGLDYADTGQVALIAAEKTSHDYAFRLVFDDAPATGAAPTPSERLFIAKIMSATEVYDQANNVMKGNASLAVNSNIVRVDAATGD